MPFQLAAYDGTTGDRIDVFGAAWWETADEITPEDKDRAYGEMCALNAAVQEAGSVEIRVEGIVDALALDLIRQLHDLSAREDLDGGEQLDAMMSVVTDLVTGVRT